MNDSAIYRERRFLDRLPLATIKIKKMKSKTIIVLVIFSLLTLIVSNSSIGQNTTTVNKLEQVNQELQQKETSKIEVNVDKDLMTFVKTAFWIAGVFLAIVSFIGFVVEYSCGLKVLDLRH